MRGLYVYTGSLNCEIYCYVVYIVCNLTCLNMFVRKALDLDLECYYRTEGIMHVCTLLFQPQPKSLLEGYVIVLQHNVPLQFITFASSL